MNLFRALESSCSYSTAYSHNLVAVDLLHAFRKDMSRLMDTRELCLLDNQISDRLFRNDYRVAMLRERLFRGSGRLPSLATSILYYFANRRLWEDGVGRLEEQYRNLFPRGLPALHEQVFILEDAIAWLCANLARLPQPFLVYYHLLPPHDPYRPRREFVGLFDDGWEPVYKETRSFSQGETQDNLNRLRREYDEYIAYADAEFGRLCEYLTRSGVLDRTYVVVTSDHGEMFERGIWRHLTPTLYEPIIRIPLLISRPGQAGRQDIFTPTSSVDLLPTLCHALSQPIPEWCEGEILPGFALQPPNPERSIYAVEAKGNPKYAPLSKATVALIKGRYKLIRYFGYPGYDDQYELYDLQDDPEEMTDLYRSETAVAAELRSELLEKLHEVNAPYRT